MLNFDSIFVKIIILTSNQDYFGYVNGLVINPFDILTSFYWFTVKHERDCYFFIQIHVNN